MISPPQLSIQLRIAPSAAMKHLPHHRFRKHLREWFGLLLEMKLITEQEFKAASENELAEDLEENPEAE